MPNSKLLILLLIVFIDLLGFGIAIPILPLLIKDVGGNPFLVGVVIALFSLFQFIFSPILGRLSDKYGRRPILIISSIINSLSYFLIFSFQGFWIILAARIIAGIGSANISVAQAYVADTTASHERTKAMALLGAAFGLGFIFGPLIASVVSELFGSTAPFLIPAILSLINTLLILVVLPESNKVLQKHIKIELINIRVTREVLRPKNMAFLMFLFFFVNLTLALIIGVFPLYSQQRFGWNEAQNGYYFALIGAGSFITQVYLIRLLLKRFTEAAIIRLALLVFGLSIVGVGLSPSGLITYILGPFSSFGFSLLTVNTQSLISLESTEDKQGMVLGVAQSFASLARTIGPLIGGAMATFNLGLPYLASGFMSLAILLLGGGYLRYMKTREKHSVK